MAAQGEASTLVLMCRGSVAAVSLLSLWVTVRWWWNRALGQGVRRPEPTIAALACNAGWFLYACTGTGAGKAEETLWVNGCCGAVQILSLLTFLALCTDEERANAFNPLAGATVFLGVAIGMGLMRADDAFFKCLCAFAGSVAASAPLLTFAFLAENWTADMLPHWFVSFVSMAHGALWLKRGIAKVPRDHYMMTQSALCMTCSFLLLALVLMFTLRRARQPTRDAPPTRGEEGNRTPLLGRGEASGPLTQDEEGDRTPISGPREAPGPLTQGEEGNRTLLLGPREALASPTTQTKTEGRKKACTVADASTSDDVPAPPRRSDRLANAERQAPPTSDDVPAPPTLPRRSERLANAERQAPPTSDDVPAPPTLPRRSEHLANAEHQAPPTSGGSQAPAATPAATPSTSRRAPRKFKPKRSTPIPGNSLAPAPARTASSSAKGKQPVSAEIQDSSNAGARRKAKKQSATGGDPGAERSAKRIKKAGV